MKKKLYVAAALLSMTALCWTAAGINPSRDVSVTPLLKTSTTWDGAQIAFPDGAPEMSAAIVELAPGGETGWHLHTAPSLAVMLDGEIEVHLKDGRVKPFKKGEALAEVINTLHNGKNLGVQPARMIVFYAGVSQKQLTLMEAEAVLEGL
jgi:quercetin dioxygenase-like cupin family protein